MPVTETVTLADMAYMAGLATGARCYGSSEITGKLAAMGLIEQGDVPVTAEAVAEFDAQVLAWRAQHRRLVTAGKWDQVQDCPAHLKPACRPTMTRGYVLTPRGEQVVTKGIAKWSGTEGGTRKA